MNLGVMLDVVIGLVFTYFLLALIASGIQEVFAAVFSWRGTYLAKGIDVILDNDRGAVFAWSLGDFFRAHFTSGPAPSTAKATLHAQIAAQAGGATAAQTKLQDVLKVATHPLMRGTPSDLPAYVPARNFATALLETLRDGSQSPLFSQVERSVAALPDGDLKKTLTAYLRHAGGDIDAFRTHLENWFDDSMDRVSGIYKRLSVYMMLILGLALAIALNVDSISLGRKLIETPSIRSALVASADTAAKGSLPTAPADPQKIIDALRSFEDQQLPIGWNDEKGTGWLAHLAGWLVTAAAVGLGAPFWFSLLQSLTNMRNAGPAPPRADAAPPPPP